MREIANTEYTVDFFPIQIHCNLPSLACMVVVPPRARALFVQDELGIATRPNPLFLLKFVVKRATTTKKKINYGFGYTSVLPSL